MRQVAAKLTAVAIVATITTATIAACCFRLNPTPPRWVKRAFGRESSRGVYEPHNRSQGHRVFGGVRVATHGRSGQGRSGAQPGKQETRCCCRTLCREVTKQVRRPNALITVTVVIDPAYAEGGRPLPRPVEFRYAGQRIRIAQVLDHWLMQGRWWEQEPETVTWRVADARGGCYELEMERVDPPMWRVVTIFD